MTTRLPGSWPQYLNVVLGLWLFVSAFAWPHTPSSRINTWILGALIVLATLSGLPSAIYRWVMGALGLWIVFSALVFPHANAATVWNNVLVAILVMLSTMVWEGEKRPR